MIKTNKGLNPANEQKQQVQSNNFKSSRCYNYGVMKKEINDISSGFIGTLTSLRLSKGISAREMSLSLGQSSDYINDIENGKSYPSMQMFFLICDYLNITPIDYFRFASDYNSDILHKINLTVQDLSKDDQILLLRTAERLKMK